MSRAEQLLLPRQIYNRMVNHALAEKPNECCGLLSGQFLPGVLQVQEWYPLVNEAASPVEFWSEPASQFRAEKSMRRAGQEIVAIYHSHPAAEPIPSKTDLERNYSPEVIHFIIGLLGIEPSVRGWWLTETDFHQAEWRLIDT